jgi:hypothetical protein
MLSKYGRWPVGGHRFWIVSGPIRGAFATRTDEGNAVVPGGGTYMRDTSGRHTATEKERHHCTVAKASP